MVNIDERVMSMKFDNSQFRRAAAETIGDLGRLRKSVKMDGVTSGLTKLSDPVKDLDKTIKTSNIKGGFKGISTAATQSFSEIESSASGVKLDGITAGVENAKRSFISLGDIASVALGGLAAKGIDKALGGLKGLYDNTLGQIKTGGMARARNLEQANFMLGGIMESEAQVKEVMDAANASVTGTAYGLDQAAKAAAQFAASGVPIDKLQTSLTGIVGVAAMTSSEFDDISRIFTTVAGNGRVFATELNSIGARGINAAAALAKHFGVTEEKVRTMVSAGEVNFEQFSTAMAEAFGPQAAKANDTYSGSLSNVRSALSRIGADTAAVKLEGMRDVFNALRPIINGVHNALKPFISTLNNNLRAAFAGVVGPLTKAGDAFTAFFDKDQGPAFAGSFRPVIEFIQDIGQVAGLVSEVLKDMVAVIFGASPRFIEMSETTTKAGTTIQHIFRKLLSVIMLVPEIIGMIIKAFRGTEDSAGSAGLSILELVDKVSGFLYITAEVIRKSKALNVIVGVIGGLFRIAAGGVAVFLKAISLIVDGIVKLRNPLEVLKDIVEYAKNHFAGIFDSLRTESLDKFFNFVVNGFNLIKNAIKNFSFASVFKDVKGFKLPKINLRGFESLSKIFDNVRDSIGKVTDGLKKIDWSPFTSIFSGGFTMPSFGDVKAIGSGIGSSVMGGINNLSWDYVLEFVTNVKNSFRDLQSYLRGLNWVSVWSSIRTNFASGAKSVLGSMGTLRDNVVEGGKKAVEALSNFGKWSLDALKNVDWAAVGKGILDGLVLAVKMIVGGAALLAIGIGDLIKSAVEKIDWEGALEGIKELGTRIRDAITDMMDAFRGVEVEGVVTQTGYIGSIQKVGETWRGMRDRVTEFFGALKSGEADLGKFKSVFGVEIGPLISAALDAATAGFDKIKGLFGDWKSIIGFVKDPISAMFKSSEASIKSGSEGVVEAADIALMSVSESITDPMTSIAESFSDVDLVGLLNGLGVALGGAGFLKFGKGFESFTNSIASVPKSISGVLDAVRDNIKGFAEVAAQEAKGNYILKLAISFGILAGSIFLLSRLSWGEIAVGMVGILAAVVVLAAGMALLDKVSAEASTLNAISLVLLSISVAVAILTYSILKLGNADLGQVGYGLLALVAILFIIHKAMGALAAAGVAKTSAQLLILSFAVGMLTSSVMMLSIINPGRLAGAMFSLIAMLLTLGATMKIMSGLNLAGNATQLMALAASILILSASVAILSMVDWDDLLKGAAVLAAVIGAFTLMSIVSSKFGGETDQLALDLIKIAAAILILTVAMTILQNVGWDSIVKGMAIFAGIVLALVLYSKFVKTLGEDAAFKDLSVDLLKVAIAISVLSFAMMMMQNIEAGGIIAGIVTVVGVLLAMAVASRIVGDKGAKLGGQLMLVAASMMMLAIVFKLIESIHPAATILGIVTLAVAIGGLVFLAKATEGMSGSLFALAGALVVVAVAFAIIAVSLMGLSMVPWQGIVIGLLAVVGVFGVFVALAIFAPAIAVGLASIGAALLTLGGGLALAGLGIMLFAASIAIFAAGITTLIALDATIGGVAVAVLTALGGLAAGMVMAAPLIGAALAAVVVALLIGIEQILVQGGPVLLSIIWELGVIFVTAIGSLIVIVVAAIMELLVTIIDTLANYAEPLMAAAANLLEQMATAFENHLPRLIVAGYNLIVAFVDGLSEAISDNAEALGASLGNAFRSVLGSMFKGYGQFFKSLFMGNEDMGIEDLEVTPNVEITPNVDIEIDEEKIKSESSSQGVELGETVKGGLQEGLGDMSMGDFQLPMLEGFSLDIDEGGLEAEGGRVPQFLGQGIESGFGDINNVLPEHITDIKSTMLGTTESAGFDEVGSKATEFFGTGMTDNLGAVETASNTVSAKASEMPNLPSEMEVAGGEAASGLAAGMTSGESIAKVQEAGRTLAAAASAASKSELEIASPSKVFTRFGEQNVEGLVVGMDSGQNETKQAGSNLALAGIEGFASAHDKVVTAGQEFADSLAKGMQNSPLNQRLRQLSSHAKAAHATAVKERKIEDQEEQERAEEERKNIYKEVEEAQKALAEAKEDLSNSEADVKESKAKAKQGEEDKKQTAAQATKAARDAQREKDKITDAEERYQKALRERDKYEYRMHGEEAGVAFVDGVAVGLMDDKEAIPSVAEILAQLLLEEVDTLKSKVGNYADVFDGLATISNTSKDMSDNVRDFTRALKRLNNATSSRSIQRNMGMLFDSTVGFMGGIQDLIGVLNIFEPFLPSLLQSFEHSLPAIAGMVAPFAPELAATLGGGLAAAVPAILGPAGGIIAAVAGIGIFLWDQANNKTILKAFKSIFAGVGGFLSKLPEMIVGGLMTLLKGVKETLNDLPGLVDFILTTFIDTVSALLEGIPEMIPLLIEGIIEAILWVLVNAPGILLEVGVALINGMAKAIDAAIKGLANVILMPFRWLTGEIGGTLDLVDVMSSAVDRMAKATGNIIRAVLNLILTPFASIYNAIGSVFGLEQIGRDAVSGFAEAIVGAMRKAIDFIAFPFIGLWNFIAGLFGWRQLAGDAASEFIFGTKKALDDGASEVASAAERMAKLMDKHVKGATRDTLADVRALIDEQVALIRAGATDGVLLGGEAAREVTNRVWSNIEDVFDMYGLGKGELEALKNAFYQGTTNPETMVSSFNNVFDHIQRILTLNKVGEGAVDSLNQSMIDSIKQGMMDESMGEFNNRGYQTGTEYVQGMISGLGASKSEIRASSQMVWDDIETVFDFYGLGDEGLEDLKRSYMSGTQNPETYAQTFEKVFSEIERKLLLADIGTESVEALRTSMVESVDYLLQPSVRDSFGGVNREIENALSSEGGQRIGEGIVQGIFSGIKNAIGSLWDFLTSPFVNLYETIRSILSDGYSIASSLVHGIVDGFWSFGNTFSNVGRDIIQGITSGVSSKAGQLFDNLVSTVTDPIGAIKRLLNIHSPSLVMMEIGRNIGDGLSIGIERSTDEVAGSMEAAGGDILSAARRMLLEVNDLLEDEVDPVITPILDLSLLKDGVDNMMGMMPNEGLNLETAMLNTTNIASLLSGVAGEAREANNITNIEFHQTNTSPEPLSEYQIYRNTERALDQVVLRNR